MNDYINTYEQSIDSYGLHKTWKALLSQTDSYSSYMIDNVSEMYEYGLAYSDKKSKKSLGKYYTPSDVGHFMAQQLLDSIGAANAQKYEYYEPCVGVGDLLLELLNEMKSRNINVPELISNHLHISDIDGTALMVANERIYRIYNVYPASAKNIDFLRSEGSIDSHDAVIMNPPYGRTTNYDDMNLVTKTIHDFYPMFLEKISKAAYSVSVVPQSFIGAESYSNLRDIMSHNAGGTIYAYDNIPAPLFNGRKHGVFNTNTSNSTRAAIIVASSLQARNGYIVSPLIRWKSAERPSLFDASVKSIKNKTRREIGPEPWAKTPRSLDQLFSKLPSMATISDIATNNGKYVLTVPASLRYYVSATYRTLDRSSKHALRFDSEAKRKAAYIALNSNLAYAFWRAYDGGITITSSLLGKIPIPVIDRNGQFIDDATEARVNEAAESMYDVEDSCISIKMNAGKRNENVKFPSDVLDKNTRILLPDESEDVLKALSDYRSPSLGWLLR